MNARTVLIARSVSIIGGTAALIAGVTFAASFQTNTVTLADNSFVTSTDNLAIYDTVHGYTGSATGFALTLVPGTESDKKPFYLKNTSGANLGISAHVAVEPNHLNVNDWAGVHVKFFDDNNHVLADTTMAALQAGQVALDSVQGSLPANTQGDGGSAGHAGNYNVTFKIDPSAVNGTSASVSNLDIDFYGTAL